MSLDALDRYLTEDQADRETCEHGYVHPCRICQVEAREREADAKREERHE